MTIYLARASGLYSSESTWSFGYLLNSTEAASSVASTFDGAISTFWNTTTDGYKNLVNADVELVETKIYTMNSSLRTLGKIVTPNSRVGINAHDSLPFQTSVWVAMYGATDTKSDRGGFKLPTPSNDMYVGDIYTSAFQASAKIILDAFFTTMRGLAGYSAIKMNPHTNKQGDPPFTQHIVTNYKVSNKPASNRQRTRKRLPTAYVTGTI